MAAFFVCTIATRECLQCNLINRERIVSNWSGMCKQSGEMVDQQLSHCNIEAGYVVTCGSSVWWQLDNAQVMADVVSMFEKPDSFRSKLGNMGPLCLMLNRWPRRGRPTLKGVSSVDKHKHQLMRSLFSWPFRNVSFEIFLHFHCNVRIL